MAVRSLLFSIVATALATACAANTDSPNDDTSDSDLVALKSLSVVQRTITEGGTVVMEYEPDEYPRDAHGRVPYLAIEFAAPSAGISAASLHPMTTTTRAPLSVKVTGKFPSEPQIIVTDARFHALASTRGHVTADGAEALLTTTTSPGTKFILVRDPLWVKPMNFQVTIGH